MISHQWENMFKNITSIQDYFKFVDSKIDQMKVQWDKFYKPYRIMMNVLKDSYSEDGLQDNSNREDNSMTTDVLNFIRGTNKLRS